jgi:hypothetical protein
VNLFGFPIEIRDRTGCHEVVLKWLADDFKDFPIGANRDKNLVVSIEDFVAPRKPLWFIKPSVSVYGWGRQKFYNYNRNVRMLVDFRKQRSASVIGPTSEVIYETLYLFILSTLGEWLEAEGWVQLHALSLEKNKRAHLLIAPSGFGKTHLAANFCREHSNVSTLGDEVVFFKNGTVMPFPLRLAKLIDDSEKSHRFTYRDGLRHKQVLESRISRTGNFTAGKFVLANQNFFAIVIGLGLPQMAEFRLRLDAIPNLALMTLNRIYFVARQEIQKIKTSRLSSQELVEFLDS